jgi:CheY-like chemotaxis protein
MLAPLSPAIFTLSEAAPTQSAVPRPPKILIVDDEPVNVKMARKYLTLAGYTEFVVTTDPTEVPSLLEHEEPDLLLLDILMPGVSGLDILKTLRAEE